MLKFNNYYWKKDNLLFRLSKKYILHVEHKNYIGGRYSVLSEVGIVPLQLMGLDKFKLRSKLLEFLQGKIKMSKRKVQFIFPIFKY